MAALQAEVEEVRLRCNTALSEREKMFTETQLKVNTAMVGSLHSLANTIF